MALRLPEGTRGSSSQPTQLKLKQILSNETQKNQPTNTLGEDRQRLREGETAIDLLTKTI